MTPQFLLWAVPILLFLTIFEIGVDFLRKEKHFSLPDTLTNISCGIGNQGINLFTEGLKLFLFIDIFFHKLSFMTIPHAWWSVLLGLLVLDFAFYWEHRFSHVVNILWGTHVVHHSSEEFNLSIALRRAWYADLVVIFFFLPIPMLGFQAETFLTAVIIHNFYQYIIHTRAVGKLPWIFEYVLHTPSHHRVHHARDPKYIDKNFSGVFILYDRLFGTFKAEEETPTFGITTPLQTNNPALVNLHYYADMVRNMKQMHSWKDRLRYLFAPPGWFPEYMGGYKPAPPVDKQQFRKYSPPAYGPLGIYALVQFLTGLGGLLFLMLVKKYLNGSLTPAWYEGVFFGLIALASVIPIAAFDRQPWVRRAELLRLALVWLAICAYVGIWHPGQALLTIVGMTLLTIGMALWFLRVWPEAVKEA